MKNKNKQADVSNLSSASKTTTQKFKSWLRAYNSQISSVFSAYCEAWLDYGFLGLRFALQTGVFSFKNFAITKLPNLIVQSYRGILAFQASLIPSIVMQKTVEQLGGVYLNKAATNTEKNLYDFAVAATGGIAGSVIVCPLEKTIIVQQKHRVSLASAVKRIYQKGLLTFMRGFTATTLRETPYAVGLWFLTPVLKNYLQPCVKKDLLDITASLSSGTIVGALTHPVDVVKTHVQVSRQKVAHQAIVKDIYRTQGIKGFFPGYVPRTLSIAGSFFWLPKLFDASYQRINAYTDDSVAQSAQMAKI